MSEVVGYTQKDFLKEHLPYRLEMVDCFATAILLAECSKIPGCQLGGEFVIPANYGLVISPTTQLMNMAFEVGLINFRLLTEFLGLKNDKHKAKFKAWIPKEESDDFHITRIICKNGTKLSTVPVEFVDGLETRAWTFNGKDCALDVASVLWKIISDANKAAGHLVVRKRPKFPLDNYLACLALKSMVMHFVYERLGCLDPLQNCGVWSTTMLRPDILAAHRKLQGEMDEFIRTQFVRNKE